MRLQEPASPRWWSGKLFTCQGWPKWHFASDGPFPMTCCGAYYNDKKITTAGHDTTVIADICTECLDAHRKVKVAA